MHDTDRVVRQPSLPAASDSGRRKRRSSRDFLDLTPTTAPSWEPPPEPRLARGTALPPIARPGLEPADSILLTERVEKVDLAEDAGDFARADRTDVVEPLPPPEADILPAHAPVTPPSSRATRRAVPTAELTAIGLPVRTLHPPRHWGSVVMCDLDGKPFARTDRPLTPERRFARGTGAVAVMPTASLRALVPAIAVVSALAVAAAILLGLLLRPEPRSAVAARPAAPTAPATTTGSGSGAPTLAPVAAPVVIQPSVVPLRDVAPSVDTTTVIPLGAR